jgi:hypothetical protein
MRWPPPSVRSTCCSTCPTTCTGTPTYGSREAASWCSRRPGWLVAFWSRTTRPSWRRTRGSSTRCFPGSPPT